ncbi:hypothetical protein JMUB6875_64420 [Nocardia sp. JMUB6875]
MNPPVICLNGHTGRVKHNTVKPTQNAGTSHITRPNRRSSDFGTATAVEPVIRHHFIGDRPQTLTRTDQIASMPIPAWSQPQERNPSTMRPPANRAPQPPPHAHTPAPLSAENALVDPNVEKSYTPVHSRAARGQSALGTG